MCKLFRHYGLGGRTDPVFVDPYVLPHLVNGDFAYGLKGWNVDFTGLDSLPTTEEKRRLGRPITSICSGRGPTLLP